VVTPDRKPAPRDPEELEARAEGPAPEISPRTTLGAVHVTVSDLDRSVGYYETAVGLAALERADGRATLGVAERPLLVLVEVPGATPASGYTGLYHFALLVPERVDLARWACPTISSARRSTSAIRTGTGSRSTRTGRARPGRASSPAG
jgi:hypothetical protein